ncbi:PadR family transcriptional regulator [Actinoplanes philippinensis]|uniref:PadR family transcriptional regulator n=1 Tax=Actinoplanes philippinensis TaxID=35752 RepID=UPI0034034802
MTTAPPKLTGPVRLVMDVLISSTVEDEDIWGLRICERTHLGPGTVYPILERLQRAGWVTSAKEPGQPSGRPPRRYYQVTAAGRVEYGAALQAQRTRLSRWISATESIAHRPRGNPA